MRLIKNIIGTLVALSGIALIAYGSLFLFNVIAIHTYFIVALCTFYGITLVLIGLENTTDTLRGHKIRKRKGRYVYHDTKEPTAGNVRPCGYCGKENTPEDHDGCLGTLPGVMNACCGHGKSNMAYVQFLDGSTVHRAEAAVIQKILKESARK